MCVSCGHTGEHCCNNSSRGCATGLTCEWDDSRSLDVCGGCGEVGERCCESRFSSTGTCNADAMCDPSSNECVTGPSGPCVGPEVFSIGVRDPNLCATEVRVVHSSSASDARSCVAMTLPPGYTTLELEDPPEEHEYCQLTPATMYRSTVQVLAFSDSDADTCARATCIDCSYTEGSCEEMDGGAPDGGP